MNKLFKSFLVVILLLIGSLAYSEGDYDKTIVVLNQSRDDKVKNVFKELMQYYEDENEDGFFSLVSEDRFLQDYMLFQQAIENDFRTYEILDFDYWIDKITSDGIKRYLYVKWVKRYQYLNGTRELVKRGYSRFLFDEINGKYKLIELAGNVLWGDSLAEWKEEIPHIAGEVPEENNLPDLTVVDVSCEDMDGYVRIKFYLKNIGSVATHAGAIEWLANHLGGMGDTSKSGTYYSDLAPGEISSQIVWEDHDNLDCSGTSIIVKVDPNNEIEESNEENNEVKIEP
ncbi:CARDB domain-containing protein [Nautilia lithotrophica]